MKRKAILYMGMLAILFAVFQVFILISINIEKSEHEGVIGGHAKESQMLIDEGEKTLYYLDVSARHSFTQALSSIARNGGVSTDCSIPGTDIMLWAENSKCSPNVGLIKELFRSELAKQLNLYLNSAPKNFFMRSGTEYPWYYAENFVFTDDFIMGTNAPIYLDKLSQKGEKIITLEIPYSFYFEHDYSFEIYKQLYDEIKRYEELYTVVESKSVVPQIRNEVLQAFELTSLFDWKIDDQCVFNGKSIAEKHSDRTIIFCATPRDELFLFPKEGEGLTYRPLQYVFAYELSEPELIQPIEPVITQNGNSVFVGFDAPRFSDGTPDVRIKQYAIYCTDHSDVKKSIGNYYIPLGSFQASVTVAVGEGSAQGGEVALCNGDSFVGDTSYYFAVLPINAQGDPMSKELYYAEYIHSSI